MKIVGRVLIAAAVVIVFGVAAVGVSLTRSVPPLDAHETLPGLSAPVDVTWDSLAIPHITAATDRDAFLALGYLHARDRLWSMEIMRRAAEGRLAEILGAAAVESDRYLRSLDIPHAAQGALVLPDSGVRDLLAAYVAGINRWIAAPTRPLPPEFRILHFAPEPWTPRQVFEVARLMSWDLVSSGIELQLATAEARVGPERVRDLFPVYPESAPVILPYGTGTWSARPGRGAGGRTSERTMTPRRHRALLSLGEIPVVPPLAQAVLERSVMSTASNSWVVAGSRTQSGRPLLANDPHLGLRAPSLWYLAAVESPHFQVAGATLPGMPGVVIGRNRRIAWGLTNIGVDDVDYVVERLSADSSRVLTATGWQPVVVERDSIRVKDAPAVPYALRRTSHGPLVTARAPGAADSGEVRALALRWNGHDPSDELTAMLAVDRAGTWDEFLAGVRGFKSPEENWVFADVDGNIGYTASGNVPVRRSGNGLLPTAGWTDEGRWERYLDFEELPRALNPPEGFIVTANNRVVGSEYPHFLTAEWELPWRARRIRQMILAGGTLGPDDLRRMQMDTLDLFAREMKGLAARAAAAAGREDLAQALRAWDGTAGADRTEPTLFYTWYRQLARETFDDELMGLYRPSGPLQAWMRAGRSRWFDDVRTPEPESLATIAERAMREAIPLAQGRRWGEVHQTVSRHALGSAALLDLLFRVNIGPRPRPGSPYTVDVAGFGAYRPPFLNTFAASFRQVADLAAPEDGLLIVTTGQSGNPLSRHYRDQVARWWGGGLFRVPLTPGRVAAIGVLHLAP